MPNLADEEAKGTLVFVPLGGSSMELWSVRLANLNRPEYYITDRDNPPPANPKYQDYLTNWNARPNCKAVCTSKRELENYLHPDTIRAIAPSFPAAIRDFDDVPMMLAEAVHTVDPAAPAWATVTHDVKKKKTSSAKRRLNTECADNMTVARLAQSDTASEITNWLREIGQRLQG